MANGMYVAAKAGFLDASLDYSASNIKAILVDTAQYTVDLATHDFLNDLNATARIAISPALASKTITAGVFDAGDTTVTAVTGATVEAIVLYHSTGASATSPLIAYIDTGTGLPFTPNGGDVILRWNAAGIITIVG